MTENVSANDLEGGHLGPYRLRRQLRESGFSLVFLAEQTAPVSRHVAIKILKRGMEARSTIRRMESEAQILAQMNHPGIPSFFESGCTPDGRPYFAMQIVEGPTVNEYCNTNRIGLRTRLGLFSQICRIVHHVHQSGVVHRNIKPSVTTIATDGTQLFPYVTSFSLATVCNAMEDDYEDRGYCHFIGTPPYASPDHASMCRFDLDARSDIYSLGVVLYELLVEHNPLDFQDLRSLPFDEVIRRIREDERLLPSDRFAFSDEAKGEIAVQRSTTSKDLIRVLRHYLDSIVMKAINLDKSQRYESAEALANDIDGILRNEAIGEHLTFGHRAKLGFKRGIDRVSSRLLAIPN